MERGNTEQAEGCLARSFPRTHGKYPELFAQLTTQRSLSQLPKVHEVKLHSTQVSRRGYINVVYRSPASEVGRFKADDNMRNFMKTLEPREIVHRRQEALHEILL